MAFDFRVTAQFPLILSLALVTLQSWSKTPYGKLQDERNFKDYTVRIYRVADLSSTNDGFGCFEILKSGNHPSRHPSKNRLLTVTGSSPRVWLTACRPVRSPFGSTTGGPKGQKRRKARKGRWRFLETSDKDGDQMV
jgi:hypothetical protein